MIHLALVAGVFLFGIVLWLVARKPLRVDLDLANPVSLIAGVVALVTFGVAQQMDRLFLHFVPPPVDMDTALQKYQVFFLVRAALLDGGALFPAVAVLLTSQLLPALFFLLCAVGLLVHRPSEREFASLMRRWLERVK